MLGTAQTPIVSNLFSFRMVILYSCSTIASQQQKLICVLRVMFYDTRALLQHRLCPPYRLISPNTGQILGGFSKNAENFETSKICTACAPKPRNMCKICSKHAKKLKNHQKRADFRIIDNQHIHSYALYFWKSTPQPMEHAQG